MTNNELNQFLL